MALNPLDRVVRDLADVKRQLAGRSQINHSSLEDSAIPVYDADGSERLRIGVQDDGTHAIKYVQGPPPPRPTAPVVSVDGPVVRVRWDGILMGGHIPEDFARIDVHFALASDDLEDLGAVKGNLATVAGNETVLAATQTGTYRVGLVAVSQSRARSEMSDTVEVDVTLVDIEGALDAVVDNARGGSNHYTPTPPAGTDHDPDRDLWFDTSEDEDGLVHYTAHRWDEDAQEWVSIGDQRTQAIQDAQREFEQSTSQALSDVQQAASGAQSAADAAAEAAGTALSTAETARDEAESKANAAQAAAEAHAEAVAEAERLAAIAAASDDASAKAAAAEAAAKAEAAQDASAKAAAAQAAAEAKAQDAQDAADAAQSSADDARSRADAAHSAAGSAADAADAAMQAATHNAKNMWSTENPSGTAPRGTIWFKIDPATKNVVGQWQQTAGSDTSFGSNWEKRSLTDALFDNIDAGKIGTGYLDVAKLLRAGAITADKVMIGNTTNLIPDPGGLGSIHDSWAGYGSGSVGDAGSAAFWRYGTTSQGYRGVRVGNTEGAFGAAQWLASSKFQVKPGEKYLIQVIGYRSELIGGFPRMGLRLGDLNDAYMGETETVTLDGTGFTTYSLIVTIPNDLTIKYARLRYTIPSSVTSGYGYFFSPVVRPAVGSTLIEPGSVNTPHLAAKSITGESGILANLDAGVITYGFMSGARLESGSVDTPQLSFGAATGDVLAVDALNFKTARGMEIVGSTFRAGDSVEITEEYGIRQFGPDGALNISLPSDGSEASFRGDLSARTFTATGSMSIEGPAQVSSGGQMQLEAGTTPPANPLNVSVVYDQTRFPEIQDDEKIMGIAWADGHWWRAVDRTGWGTGGDRVEKITPTGELVSSFPVEGFWARNWITAIGSELYMLGQKSSDATRRFVRVYSLNGAVLREWEYTQFGTGTYQPGIGTDGTNVVIAQCWSSGYLSWRRFNRTTGALVSQTDSSAHFAGDCSGVYEGSADFGTTRVVVGKRLAPSTHRQFQVFDGQGTFLSGDSWYTPGRESEIRGFAWADGRFHSMSADGVLTTYAPISTSTQTGDGSTVWWLAHTWASASEETPIAPGRKFQWPARSQLRVSLQEAPRGADRAHLYLGRGVNEPSRTGLHRVATATATTADLPPIPTMWQEGTVPPETNTFEDDTPGLIRSTRGEFEVRGDGSGRWGPLTFHADGTMTSSAVPEWVPITAFQSGFSPQTWGFVPAYRIWPDGKVEWRGVVNGTVNGNVPAFTIPAEAIPPHPVNLPVSASASAGQDALVRVEFGQLDTPHLLIVYRGAVERRWFGLDGVYYYLA